MACSGRLSSFNLKEDFVILVTLFISALPSKFLTTKTISMSSANLVHKTSPSFSGFAYLSHNNSASFLDKYNFSIDKLDKNWYLVIEPLRRGS